MGSNKDFSYKNFFRNKFQSLAWTLNTFLRFLRSIVDDRVGFWLFFRLKSNTDPLFSPPPHYSSHVIVSAVLTYSVVDGLAFAAGLRATAPAHGQHEQQRRDHCHSHSQQHQQVYLQHDAQNAQVILLILKRFLK